MTAPTAATAAAPALRHVLALAAAAVVACAAVAVVVDGRTVGHANPAAGHALALVSAASRFDSGWYASIARDGYWYTPGQQSPVAFFPGYPLAVRAVMVLARDAFLAGALLSLGCGLGAVALFVRWARGRAGEAAARDAGVLLVLYPLAFFLYGAVYADAFFLVLVVGAFLALERGWLWAAVLLGIVATATRPVAPALVLGLVARRLEWKRERGERWDVWDVAPALAGLGLVGWMGYLWHAFGEPMAFAKVQSAPGWDQAPGPRTWLKLRWLHAVVHGPARDLPRLLGHAAATAVGLALVPATFKRLGWGYGLFTLAVLGIPALGTKDFMGMGRYLLAAFPLFLTAALLLSGRRRLFWGVATLSALGLLVLTAGWGAHWYIT